MRAADLALLLLEPQAHGEREQREGEASRSRAKIANRRASPASVGSPPRPLRSAAPHGALASARRLTRSQTARSTVGGDQVRATSASGTREVSRAR